MTRLQRWKLDAVKAVRHFNEAMQDAGKLSYCESVSQQEWTFLWEAWKGEPRPYCECLFASPVELKAFRAWVEEDDGKPHQCDCYLCRQHRAVEAKQESAHV